MMKSLLSILKEEDDAVYEYSCIVKDIRSLVVEREKVEETLFDHETKSEYIRWCNSRISTKENMAEEDKQKVNQARKELRDYIVMLLENE